MSTLKSSAEDLTLNADGSGNDIKFQSNAVEVGELTDGGVLSSTGGSTHADNVKAKFGTGDDLEIYHDGTRNYIDSKSSQLRVETDALRLRSDGGETYLEADVDGAVQIYWDNNKKLETTSGGVTVTGDATITSGDIVFSTAGKGICLGVTSNTDSNTLDDYEVGTWSPNIGGNATYSNQVGNYIKIGNLVWAHYAMTINTKGTGSVVGAIYGVPFASGYASQNSVAMHWGGLATGIVHGTYYLGAGGVLLGFSNTTASATDLGNNPDIWQDGAAMIGVHIYSIA